MFELTKHELIPLLRKEFPKRPQPLLQIPFHVYVIFEYEDNVVIPVSDLA
jgi:hypothetical protein